MLVKKHYEGNSREWCTGVNKIPQRGVWFVNPNINDQNVSYYRKARVIEWEDGWVALISYNTIVALISPSKYPEFYRTWDGYSPTSMKHINTFRTDFDFSPIGKAGWDDTKVVSHLDFREFSISHDMEYEYIPFTTMYGYSY